MKGMLSVIVLSANGLHSPIKGKDKVQCMQFIRETLNEQTLPLPRKQKQTKKQESIWKVSVKMEPDCRHWAGVLEGAGR
jgi:hypothetical protein